LLELGFELKVGVLLQVAADDRCLAEVLLEQITIDDLDLLA
jgi:hypothetical protein